jgi:peptidoglycan/xylan/chitin deacetylase (PgdA/CDA1 family)
MVPILMYHDVAEEGPRATARYRVYPTAFAQQMQLLHNMGYSSFTLQEWADCIVARRPPRERRVVITFDDGFRSVVRNAWPILSKAGFRATVFVVTGRVGKVADWDQVSGVPPELMDWDELRELQREGNVIASHCLWHRDLTQLSDELITLDSHEARTALFREMGREVCEIAYPWGKTDPRVKRILEKSGYRIGVGVSGRLSKIGDDLMLLPRIEIFGNDDLRSFKAKLEMGDSAIETASDFVGFGAGSQRTVHRHETGDLERASIEELRALSTRLREPIEELIAIKAELDGMCAAASRSARRAGPHQQKLGALFAQAATGSVTQALVPFQEVSPGIRIGFPPDARVNFASISEYRAGPGDQDTLIRLAIRDGGWLSVEVSLDDGVLAGAQRYRVELTARPNRRVDCQFLLRQHQAVGFEDLDLGRVSLDPNHFTEEVSGHLSGWANRTGVGTSFIVTWQAGSEPLEFELRDLYFEFE